MIGKDWWGDQWWLDAVASGLVDVECHSWDHVHPELDQVAQQNQDKGDFSAVDNFADADIQFRRAGDYIGQILNGRRPDLFAYPYGSASHYVVSEYLPKHQAEHGFRAAFTTQARAVSKTDNVWLLPRYVFGHDWKSPRGLEELLGRV
jgi:peptidoglycan/xylan/chitin deacetylase (PgdA/CDA1 family)